MVVTVVVLLSSAGAASASGPRGMAIVAVDDVVCVRFARPFGRIDEEAVVRCPHHTPHNAPFFHHYPIIPALSLSLV